MSVTSAMSCAIQQSLALKASGPEKTAQAAAILARQCRTGDCILLQGGVGSGKTTFARAFIKAISPTQEDIVSPTFMLVQDYPLYDSGPLYDGGTLWHFDLYRLKHPQELVEIGLEDALSSGITLIEWPEMAEHMLPEAALHITIATTGNPDTRLLHFTGDSTAWEGRLDALKAAYDH